MQKEMEETPEAKLTEALKKLVRESPTNKIKLDDVRAGNVNVQHMRSVKKEQGCLFIEQAFSNDALSSAREEALKAWKKDVLPQLEDVQVFPENLMDLTKNKEFWKTGIIGNAGFGYLLLHPESAKEMPSLSLRSTGAKITVAPGSAYKANIELVAHETSQLAMAILFSVSGNPSGQVSQDFCKVHRGDMTKAHVDIYEDEEALIHRTQAIAIGLGEGTVRLCYLRFSHNPEIQSLINLICGKNIYSSRGFQAVPKTESSAIIKCFLDAGCIQYGNPRDLVIWEPGVIHLEMKVKPFLQVRNDKKTTTERYVVGTHTPVGFNDKEKEEIAFINDRGFVFHPYNNANRGSAAGLNSVHRKKTQWKIPRKRSEEEKKRLEDVQQALDERTAVDLCIGEMPPRKRHCLGINQSADSMYNDEVARRVHNE
jgi:hypothetical protein